MCIWGLELQDVQYAVALAVMALVERAWSSRDERVDAMLFSRGMKSDVWRGRGQHLERVICRSHDRLSNISVQSLEDSAGKYYILEPGSS